MDLKRLILEIVEEGKPSFLASLDIQLGLIERIKAAQERDTRCTELKAMIKKGESSYFYSISKQILRYRNQICVPDDEGLQKEIMEEAQYCFVYTVHLGSTKIYRDFKECFLWSNMKRDVAKILE